jgi:hypothetical protein
VACAWSLSVLMADAAAAAGSSDATGPALASPLSPLLGAANGPLSEAAQAVGGAVDGGAQTVGAAPVGPELMPVTSTVQSVASSVPRSGPAVLPGPGVTPGMVAPTTTTSTTPTLSSSSSVSTAHAGKPARSPSPAGAAGSGTGETFTTWGAGHHTGSTGPGPSTLSKPSGTPAEPVPKRPVPGVPTLFSLLATAGATGSPFHGHGSSEGMPPVSALLPLLVGGCAPLGGGRHARWLFDARGPPPG